MELLEQMQNNIDEWTQIFIELEEMESRKDLVTYSSAQFDYFLRFLNKKALPSDIGTINGKYLNVFNFSLLWDLFADTCNRYNKVPGLQNYCIFLGITTDQVTKAKSRKYAKSTINKAYNDYLMLCDDDYLNYVIDLINNLCDSNYQIDDIKKYQKEYSKTDNVVFNTTSSDSNNIYNNTNNIDNNIDNYYINYYNISFIVLNNILYNIYNYKEIVLEYGLIDGKKNPLGTIAVLKHEYKWETEKTSSLENTSFSDVSSLPDFSSDVKWLSEKRQK